MLFSEEDKHDKSKQYRDVQNSILGLECSGISQNILFFSWNVPDWAIPGEEQNIVENFRIFRAWNAVLHKINQ